VSDQVNAMLIKSGGEVPWRSLITFQIKICTAVYEVVGLLTGRTACIFICYSLIKINST
jgi:hypothetical protein